MSEFLFSASWYRVAHLVPQLRSHVYFHRHINRGQVWHVLEDRATRRSHRLSESAYRLAGLMDGRRTVDEIWQAAVESLGDDALTQDETIRLIGLLHSADAIRCDVTPDTFEILRRCQRRESAEWWQRYANPLSVRVPLVDPDAWLEKLAPVARRCLRWPVGLAALLLVLAGALVAARNWTELTAGAASRLLEPGNLIVMLAVYPLMKALHELGHALTAKVYGAEVREMGVLFLVMMPVPYVDASGASVWPEKSRRIAVGAAGVAVELLLGALALLVWAAVEPGWLRTIAFDIAWIAAASSLLVNGNPLLRFDGYYVLSDALEIPNLRQRSTQYLMWWVQRYVFGLTAVRDPVSAPGEAPWLASFGIASLAYRFVILFAIAIFLSERFFVFGTLLAIFAVATQCVVPLARGLRFLLTSPRLGSHRTRALGLSAGAAASLLIGVAVVPVPLHTRAEGVVWPPANAHVRARSAGFVVELLAAPGSQVEAGQALLRVRDPVLDTRLEIELARLRALEARQHSERFRDRVRAQITQDEVGAAEASVVRARERIGDVIVRSAAFGEFVTPGRGDLEGRFVEQGELIGYVVGDVTSTVRVVLPQSEAARIRERVEAVEVRTVANPPRVASAVVAREVPGSASRLPSAALGTRGGGRIPIDPRDPSGLTPSESVFQLDLELPPSFAAGGIGSRVHVRFDHGSDPVVERGLRSLQRLFLGRLGG